MKRVVLMLAVVSVLLLAFGMANASDAREEKLAAYINAVMDTAVEKFGGTYDFKTVSEAVTYAQDEHSDLFNSYFRKVQNDVKRKRRWRSLKSTVVRRSKKVLQQNLHDQIALLVGLTNIRIAEFEAVLKKEVSP
ncbi:hypothetical protein [Desulfovibrio sp. JC022]|uniref:hypothetical protein n=1 Tax=Desulfovibrio sp. JC022 TaxID=2593642 RepID=UPI0013D2AB21|nr:hypothetical protein [Desulfovibrio sp. JC022]NDV21457.1 hypothetical protein [Desulfovibrio sp. JC022]